MSKPIAENSGYLKLINRFVVHCCAVLGGLLLFAAQANALVILKNQLSTVSLPVALGGVNIQPGAYLGVGSSEVQIDTATNSLRGVTLEEVVATSTSQPVSRMFDLDVELGEGDFSGHARGQAGGGENFVELSLSRINLVPGLWGNTVSASSVEYQIVRFASPSDQTIGVDASYRLESSLVGGVGSLQTTQRALGVMQILDLSSITNTREADGFVSGQTEVALFDLSLAGGPDETVDATETFSAWTNRDYLIVFGGAVIIDFDTVIRSSFDVLLSASATAPSFFVSDPSVSVVRSTLASNSATVPEPSVFGLLSLSIIGLCLTRRRLV